MNGGGKERKEKKKPVLMGESQQTFKKNMGHITYPQNLLTDIKIGFILFMKKIEILLTYFRRIQSLQQQHQQQPPVIFSN